MSTAEIYFDKSIKEAGLLSEQMLHELSQIRVMTES